MSEYDIDVKRMLVRLHRISGQLQAVERMVEDQKPCVDVLMQISAVTAALRVVAIKTAQQEIAQRVQQARQGDDTNSIEETQAIMHVIDRLLKYEKS